MIQVFQILAHHVRRNARRYESQNTACISMPGCARAAKIQGHWKSLAWCSKYTYQNSVSCAHTGLCHSQPLGNRHRRKHNNSPCFLFLCSDVSKTGLCAGRRQTKASRAQDREPADKAPANEEQAIVRQKAVMLPAAKTAGSLPLVVPGTILHLAHSHSRKTRSAGVYDKANKNDAQKTDKAQFKSQGTSCIFSRAMAIILADGLLHGVRQFGPNCPSDKANSRQRQLEKNNKLRQKNKSTPSFAGEWLCTHCSIACLPASGRQAREAPQVIQSKRLE